MLVIDIVHDFRFTNTNTHLISEESHLKHFDMIHYSQLNPKFRMQSNHSIRLSLRILRVHYQTTYFLVLAIFVFLDMITVSL